MSPPLLQVLLVLHGGSVSDFCCVFQVQIELSFVTASLSLHSANVSVDPTVAVRVTSVYSCHKWRCDYTGVDVCLRFPPGHL